MSPRRTEALPKSERGEAIPGSQPAWVKVIGFRFAPLLVILLVVLVALRVIGPLTSLWFDQAILWSIAAAGVCWICFAAASVVDLVVRGRSQPVGGPLIAIGIRTGGVAVAAAVVAVGFPQGPGRWFLLSLGCCYVAALVVDTWQWVRELNANEPGT